MYGSLTMRESTQKLLIFGALLGWCAVLVAFRVMQSESLKYTFLLFNLFLAAVPAAAARLFVNAAEHRPLALQIVWFAVWLVFLPNAPYIVTDFIHIEELPQVPLWYDVALIASCAGTGLLLGYSSLADVQAVIARKVSVRAGWAVALSAFFLSGFGIYLGRFLRWNSWDAVANPLELFADIAEHLLDPLYYARTFGVTVIYGVALLLGYVALRVLHLGGNAAPDRV